MSIIKRQDDWIQPSILSYTTDGEQYGPLVSSPYSGSEADLPDEQEWEQQGWLSVAEGSFRFWDDEQEEL